MESVKKRHRRTKAELLQDPAYCAKHGIKYVKGEIKKPILTTEKKKAAKKETQKEEPKKRHRRTKEELLQDPVYCAKHGIKCSKLQKDATKPGKNPGKAATSVRKKVEKVANQEPKKRHRRTKAELLQDPVYRKKHHLDDPKITNVANVPVIKKPRKPKKENLPTNQAIAEIEEEWMAKMYKHWEGVQSCMSGMEMELCDFLGKKQGRLGLQEFDSLDYNLGQMENRFQDFDQAIDRRRHME